MSDRRFARLRRDVPIGGIITRVTDSLLLHPWCRLRCPNLPGGYLVIAVGFDTPPGSWSVAVSRLTSEPILLLALHLCAVGTITCDGHAADPPAVMPLLEDNAETLLPHLTNPTGDPGEGHVERTDFFSGTSCVRIVPMQRFHPAIPGWDYRIAEKPGPGEYRYLRFAWKADGCAGIMLQLHDEKDWRVRYTAGVDRFNWGTKFVAEAPPSKWVVVTRDLYGDYGEGRTIRGMALTAFDGKAAYFDHIYLGRTVEDLDRVDATGERDGPRPEPSTAELGRLWGDLSADDAPRAYRAFWRLTATAKSSAPFIVRKLAISPEGPNADAIRKWVRDLDNDAFLVREAASALLRRHLDIATPHLEDALQRGASPEVRMRANVLLELNRGRSTEAERVAKAIRVLEYAGGPEARAGLATLAGGPDGSRATVAARAALQRLPGASK